MLSASNASITGGNTAERGTSGAVFPVRVNAFVMVFLSVLLEVLDRSSADASHFDVIPSATNQATNDR